MKSLRLLALFAVALCASALSSKAAVIHDTTLSGSDVEMVTFYDQEFNPLNWVNSFGWEVEIKIYDDQEGYIQYRWWNGYGWIYQTDTVGADFSYWYSDSITSPNTAFLATINYLFPLIWE